MIKNYFKTILLKKGNKIFELIRRKTTFTGNFWERSRIKRIPQNKVFSTHLLHKKILVSDSKWYLPTVQEIWQNQIYKFDASKHNPLIIDCGANIGLSVIYWKYLYPDARVIAFEPDPNIFELLTFNIGEFDLHNVNLSQLAVWTSSTELFFKPDGGVGGKLVNQSDNSQFIKVNTIRLLDLLDQPIDLLKIDIEGAEYEVIQDCSKGLSKVEKIFLEYHGAATEQQSLQLILQILQDSGFRYHIKDAYPIRHPFISSERGKLYDLQLNIFGFRV